MKQSFNDALYHKLIKTLAILITLMGAFFLVCWFGGFYTLLQLPPADWPIPFSGAWCIFFSGLGFLAILQPSRFMVKEYFAVPIFLLSSLRLLEPLFQYDLGISWFLLKLLHYTPPIFPSMPVIAAMGFVIVSIILFLWPRTLSINTKGTLLISLSSLLLLIGFMGILSYILPTTIVFGWPNVLIIHFYGAVAQILLGLGFLIHRFYTDIYKKTNAIRWISLFSASLLFIFVLQINYGLSTGNKLALESILKSKIETARFFYRLKITNDVDFLMRITHQIEQHQAIPADLVDQTRSFINDNKEFNRLFWTDKNFIVQGDLPNNTVIGLPASISQDLRQYFIQHPSQKTPFFSIHPEHGNLLICSPIIRDSQFQGVCITEIEIKQIFQPIVNHLDHNYIFLVLYENSVIFSSNAIEEKLQSIYVSEEISIENLSLIFTIYPFKTLTEYNLNNFFRIMIFIGGTLLSISLGYLIFLWHSWQTLAQTTQRIIRFSEALMKRLNQLDTLSESCHELLKLINELHPWDMLILWRWNSSIKTLECSEIIYASSIEFPHFELFVRQTIPVDITNLAKKVLMDRKPTALVDLGSENYLCSASAAQDGIKGTLAFPMFEGDKACGVIVILKRNIFIEYLEPELMDLLPTIGIEFGQFIQRKELAKIRDEATALIQNSVEAIFSLDIDGNVKTWNPGAEKMYGWAAREIIGKNIFDLTFPTKNTNEIAARKKTFREGKQELNSEGQRRKKDGSLMWVHISNSPIYDETGNILGAAIVARDITERKLAINQLAESEEKLRSFIESSEDWLWEMDVAGHYTYTNSAIQKVLGFTPAELKELDLFFFLSEEDQQKVKLDMAFCVESKTGWHRRILSMKKKNGKFCWIESSGSPFLNEHKQVAGFRGADQDISERIDTEIAKNEFISMISHELRTPLTSIIGSLGLMAMDPKFSDRNKELVTIANRNAQRLVRILNDILDIEKIQLGKLQLSIQQIIYAKTIREAIEIAKPLAEELQVAIVEKSMLENVLVNADHDRLIQVMLNILSNAIKFSPQQGNITVWMERVGDQVRVSIQDEGKGIPEEFQSKIFEKFKQADQSDSRAASGTGLGLSICKNLITLMGGSIHFTTKQNVGTIFYFDLPIVG